MATTVEQFVNLVYQYARAHGQPFLKWQEQAELRAYISRQLFRFVEETKVLYDDNVTAETVDGTGTYDLLDTDIFSRAVLEPEFVYIAGDVLLDDDGMPGLISAAQANDYIANFRTAAEARPTKAYLMPPQTLRLIATPDDEYAVVISGWVQHFDLTGASVYDTTAMQLGDGSIDAAAMYCAGQLISVGAEGPGLEAGISLSNAGMAMAKKAAGRAASFLQGPMVRGQRTYSTYSLD